MKQDMLEGAQRAQMGLTSFEDLLEIFETHNKAYLNEVN